jgi:hypothetical protein
MNSPITVWRWELDEFDARAVENDVLIDIADCAADHSPLYYDRALTKRESKIVREIGLEGESAFDLDAVPRLMPLTANGCSIITSP